MTDEIDIPTAYQPAKQISFFAQLRRRCRRDERRNQTLRSFDLLRNGACRECFGTESLCHVAGRSIQLRDIRTTARGLLSYSCSISPGARRKTEFPTAMRENCVGKRN